MTVFSDSRLPAGNTDFQIDDGLPAVPMSDAPDDWSMSATPNGNGQHAPVTLLETAREYAATCLSVLPISLDPAPAKVDYLKRPIGYLLPKNGDGKPTWKPFQQDIPDDATIAGWFTKPKPYMGLGVVTGEVSGGLECIDVDDGSILEKFKATVNHNEPGLFDQLLIERTRSGGYHIVYRCAEIEGSQDLAKTPRELPGHKRGADGTTTLIETRGEGGFLVISPSAGYTVSQGDWRDIQSISVVHRELLLNCARMLDETGSGQPLANLPTVTPAALVTTPKTPANHSAVYDVLTRHGWALVKVKGKPGEADSVEFWRRPGKSEGHSATWNYLDDRLFVQSSNAAPFEQNHGYSLAQIQALLEPEATAKRRYTLHTAQESLEPQPPIEWIIERVFSAGSVSMVAGEGGSKKTYSMLDAAVCVARGKRWLDFATLKSPVLIIDEESGKRRMYRRLGDTLRGHDAGPDTLIHFTTIEQFDLLSLADVLAIEAAVEETGARFIIIDALADVMPGGDENAVKDTQPVFRALRGIAEHTDSAIVVIHHVNKAGQYRGSTAIKGAVDALLIVQSKPDENHIGFEFDKARDVEPFKFAALANFAEGVFNLSPGMARVKKDVLPDGQRYVIRYLKANGGAASLKDIGEHAEGVTEGGAKNAALKLANRGYVKRVDAGGKGSAAVYGLTDKGQEYDD